MGIKTVKMQKKMTYKFITHISVYICTLCREKIKLLKNSGGFCLYFMYFSFTVGDTLK